MDYANISMLQILIQIIAPDGRRPGRAEKAHN
jgi:hypothetical protein